MSVKHCKLALPSFEPENQGGEGIAEPDVEVEED